MSRLTAVPVQSLTIADSRLGSTLGQRAAALAPGRATYCSFGRLAPVGQFNLGGMRLRKARGACEAPATAIHTKYACHPGAPPRDGHPQT